MIFSCLVQQFCYQMLDLYWHFWLYVYIDISKRVLNHSILKRNRVTIFRTRFFVINGYLNVCKGLQSCFLKHYCRHKSFLVTLNRGLLLVLLEVEMGWLQLKRSQIDKIVVDLQTLVEWAGSTSTGLVTGGKP